MSSGSKKKCAIFLSLAILLTFIFIFNKLFIVPKSLRLVSNETLDACINYPDYSYLDITKDLNLVSWNIYKLNKQGWKKELAELSSSNDLLLLQEAISSKELYQEFKNKNWNIDQAYAFSLFDNISGVMTLSKLSPKKVCVFQQMEPWIRLPKTALLSVYMLSNFQNLAIINIHSVNFTLGLNDFTKQLDNIISTLESFNGPIIFAGDFNTWSEKRLAVAKKVLNRLNLKQVNFSPDERLFVFGNALDQIFYRGMELKKAQSKNTSVSDHAWLQASFRFKN